MSRKAFIHTCLVLGVLCVALALAPMALQALGQATGHAAAPASGAAATRAAQELLGARGDTPPTLSEWIESRTGDDPTQLKLIGTGDPDMTVEERMRLLDEAEKNQPKVAPVAADSGKAKPKRKKSRQPAKVLPADEKDKG